MVHTYLMKNTIKWHCMWCTCQRIYFVHLSPFWLFRLWKMHTRRLVYQNRVCFPELNFVDQTDDSIMLRYQKYNLGNSVLENLNIGMPYTIWIHAPNLSRCHEKTSKIVVRWRSKVQNSIENCKRNIRKPFEHSELYSWRILSHHNPFNI